jgi:hypothetical protein
MDINKSNTATGYTPQTELLNSFLTKIIYWFIYQGEQVAQLVEALCCKPGGRGFIGIFMDIIP